MSSQQQFVELNNIGLLDQEEYLALLTEIVSNAERLQNSAKFTPEERLTADIVKRVLKDCPYITIEEIATVPERPNLVIKYCNTEDGIIPTEALGCIGSHFDVVPAKKENWRFNPFELTQDPDNSDKYFGRGSTDCGCNIALLALLLRNLSRNNVKLPFVFCVVFIADEEYGVDKSVGVFSVVEQGKVNFLKDMPCYWVDGSNGAQGILNSGSGTYSTWTLTTTGKSGHSGLPYNTINPILLAFQGVELLIKYFNTIAPPSPQEQEYNFPCSSTMKPTQIDGTTNGLNQIPDALVIKGDIRLMPWCDVVEVQEKLTNYVEIMNESIESFPKLHSAFPNVLYADEDEKTNDFPLLNPVDCSEISQPGADDRCPLAPKCSGKFKLEWSPKIYQGVACSNESLSYKLISEANNEIIGRTKIESCARSLPLIYELMKTGLDFQIMGYGRSDAYHADDEYVMISDVLIGYKIMCHILQNYCKIITNKKPYLMLPALFNNLVLVEGFSIDNGSTYGEYIALTLCKLLTEDQIKILKQTVLPEYALNLLRTFGISYTHDDNRFN
jgi:acetylornithine deacetylase